MYDDYAIEFVIGVFSRRSAFDMGGGGGTGGSAGSPTSGST